MIRYTIIRAHIAKKAKNPISLPYNCYFIAWCCTKIIFNTINRAIFILNREIGWFSLLHKNWEISRQIETWKLWLRFGKFAKIPNTPVDVGGVTVWNHLYKCQISRQSQTYVCIYVYVWNFGTIYPALVIQIEMWHTHTLDLNWTAFHC